MLPGALFNWRALAREPLPLDERDGLAGLSVDEVMRAVSNVRIATGAGTRNIRLSNERDALEPLFEELLTTPHATPDAAVRMAHGLLHRAPRVYPLTPSGVSESTHTSLGGAFEHDGRKVVTVLTLETGPRRSKQAPSRLLSAELRVLDTRDEGALSALFETLYLRTDPSRRRAIAPQPSVLWLTGQGHADLPRDWFARVEAMIAVYGSAVVGIDSSSRGRVIDGLRAERQSGVPVAVCGWVSRIPTKVTRELRILTEGYNYLAVTSRGLEDALEEARERLAAFRDELGSAPPVHGEPTPGLNYYRKQASARRHDVMVRIAGHGHDNWQGARGKHGEKAGKGIERLERGASVSKLERCATCQAGSARSVWRAMIELSEGTER